MEWLDGGTLPWAGKARRSDGRVNNGTERVADDRPSGNEGRRWDLVKVSCTPRFQIGKGLLAPLRSGRL